MKKSSIGTFIVGVCTGLISAVLIEYFTPRPLTKVNHISPKSTNYDEDENEEEFFAHTTNNLRQCIDEWAASEFIKHESLQNIAEWCNDYADELEFDTIKDDDEWDSCDDEYDYYPEKYQ